MPKSDDAEAIPRELAERLHRELKKRGVIYELLPNGTRVSLPTRQKPPAVIIGQTGFELLPKGLRFFRAKRDQRLDLPRVRQRLLKYARELWAETGHRPGLSYHAFDASRGSH